VVGSRKASNNRLAASAVSCGDYERKEKHGRMSDPRSSAAAGRQQQKSLEARRQDELFQKIELVSSDIAKQFNTRLKSAATLPVLAVLTTSASFATT
jgi:hypothetical protein